MSGAALYTELGWLPQPPQDFRDQCRRIAADPAATGRDIIALARHALDENQLRRLAAAIETRRAAGLSLATLTPFRLGILGNATLDPLPPALVASAARHGIDLTCIRADYGQTIQEATRGDSIINSAKPDAVLLALDYRGIPLRFGVYDAEAAKATIASAVEYLDVLRSGFREHSGAVCIVQTLAPPAESVFGNYDRAVPGTPRRLIGDFNDALVASLKDTPDVLFDVGALAETVGLANWYSPTYWHFSKLPFDGVLLPLYADHVARLIGAMRGKSSKALVLDLDNTLWGGVIGDDGVEGIVLGQGDPVGEAHLDTQQAALTLRGRGIVLCVSSKNEDAVARSAFQQHPDMLLREDHIAVFQANWTDKATNIAAIASELNLGIDSLVFLDDNPVERGLVRKLAPDVAVPEIPLDPALHARALSAAGYFEAITFSEEDRKRADLYQDNARRAAFQKSAGDVQGYLASLDMTIVFRPFDAKGRSRIAQLINKSNQFNLTTRRYTEADVAAIEDDARYFTLQTRLMDAFGDNGIIGINICRQGEPDEWEIDTWLMSCRVLGRRVEEMVLREMLFHARERGVLRLVGYYYPTEKNAMVKDLYPRLGFRPRGGGESGSTVWEIDTGTEVEAAPMTVDRADFELARI